MGVTGLNMIHFSVGNCFSVGKKGDYKGENQRSFSRRRSRYLV